MSTGVETETRGSARQLIKSLKHYQLDELAILLAAIHEEDTAHSVSQIIYSELRRAGRNHDAESFVTVHEMMVEKH